MSAEIPESFFEVLDEKDPVVTGDLAAEWPDKILQYLEELLILERIEDATELPCDACDDQHSTLVHVIDGKPYGACPLEGRSEIDAARLARWIINADALATRVAECVGGRIRVELPGQLWSLGSVALGGSQRPLFLARQISRDSDDATLRRTFVPEGRREAVVLAVCVPQRLPTMRGAPLVFPLHAALRLERHSLAVANALFNELVDRKVKPTNKRRLRVPLTATWRDVALVVSDRALRVRIWSGPSLHLDETLTYDEAGFEDRRERKPNEHWRLLKDLASERGSLSFESAKPLKLRVSKLRAALRGVIPIKESPIVCADDSYRAEFFIRRDALTDCRFPPAASWDEASISVEERNRLRVTAKERVVILEFEELQLVDAAGEQTRSGRELFEMLEKGALTRSTLSKGIMERNQAMQILRLVGEPFLTEPVPGGEESFLWRPRFRLVDARVGSR